MSEQLGTLTEVPVEKVRPFKDQPRKYFDKVKLQELADSIEAIGQKTPAHVKRLKGDKAHDYELIDGQRRWHACQMAKKTKLKVIIFENVSDKEQFELSVLANFCRENHSPLETARAIQKFHIDGMNQGEIAKKFGLSGSFVSQHLKLLKLCKEVQDLLEPSLPKEQRLRMSAALLIADLPRGMQIETAQVVIARKMTSSGATSYIRKIGGDFGVKVGGSEGARPVHDYRLLKDSVGRIRRELLSYEDKERAFFDRLFANRPSFDKEDMLASLAVSIDKLTELREAMGAAGKASGERLARLREMAERQEALFGSDEDEDDDNDEDAA